MQIQAKTNRKLQQKGKTKIAPSVGTSKGGPRPPRDKNAKLFDDLAKKWSRNKI